MLNTMLGKQVDGIVFMGENITKEHVEEFEKNHRYLSYLLLLFDGENITPSVNIDYEQAAYDAIKHLLDKGHTRIGFVSGPYAEAALNHKKSSLGTKRRLQRLVFLMMKRL
ncbi:hypothetical protein GCM10020331_031380 [Ectobacillus funiculus]